MAVTYSYVIMPHQRRADGTNFIRIRVTHARKSKYIKTNVAVEPSDLTRSGTLKNKGKIDLVQDEIRQMRRITDELPMFSLEAMDVADVVAYVTKKLAEPKRFSLDFIAFGMEQVAKMKLSTGKAYTTALNALALYYKKNPDIFDITVKAMRGFEDSLRDAGKLSAVAQYPRLIASLYRKARKIYNEPDLGIIRIPIDIFEYYEMPKPPAPEHRDIPAEWVQLMIDQREELTGMERVAVDAFLISFCLMGMNAEDMYNASEPPKDGVVHYYRTKTTDNRDDKAEMYVRIESCLQPIARDYWGKDSLFNFSERYSTTKSMQHCVSKGLKKWIERNKLDDFTFYAARHTWGTLAGSKDADVDSAMITEGLCHSGGMNKMDRIYVRKDWERVWDANAKVLGLFDWHGVCHK